VACRVRGAALALLLRGAGGCEHTAGVEPLSPRRTPAASAQNPEMSALVATLQRELRAQEPVDPQREELVEALATAAQLGAPQGAGNRSTPGAMPPGVEQALTRLLASPGDTAAAVRVLETLVRPDSGVP
jgi:hypothetical protein